VSRDSKSDLLSPVSHNKKKLFNGHHDPSHKCLVVGRVWDPDIPLLPPTTAPLGAATTAAATPATSSRNNTAAVVNTTADTAGNTAKRNA